MFTFAPSHDSPSFPNRSDSSSDPLISPSTIFMIIPKRVSFFLHPPLALTPLSSLLPYAFHTSSPLPPPHSQDALHHNHRVHNPITSQSALSQTLHPSSLATTSPTETPNGPNGTLTPSPTTTPHPTSSAPSSPQSPTHTKDAAAQS